jgi:hypothetical protein
VDDFRLPSWSLPLIVIGLVVPPFLGFALGGAAAGTAAGAATVALVIVIASRLRTREPIRLARRSAPETPLIAVALAPIEDGATANELATLAEAARDDWEDDGRGGAEILVLSPARPTRAQRWLSDEEPGRVAASERLAVSIATLTVAGTHAEGRVVSEDPVQALEDAAAEHGARRVAIVVSGSEHDEMIAALGERLDVPINRVTAPE